MKRDTITIVLVSDSREPLTIEISIRELVLFIVLILSLVGAAVYSMYNYRNLKSQHAQLKFSVRQLQVDLAAREEQIRVLKDRLDKQKDLVLIVGENQDTSQVPPGQFSQDVLIDNLQINTSADSLKLSFMLTNNSHEERLLSGYLQIVAEHESGDIEKFATFPAVDLAAGKGLDYRKGDTYAIRNFKSVEVAIKLKDVAKHYNKLKFLIFNANGGVLVHENRPLTW